MMKPTMFIDGDLNVEYRPNFYPSDDADFLFSELLKLPFYTPTFNIRGRSCRPNRKVCAYADEGVVYEYSGARVCTHAWTPLLRNIKEFVEKETSCFYNHVLLNLYEDGNSKISAHKDDESSLMENVPLAVLSFGAERTIVFKDCRSSNVTPIKLQHGSLYIMHPPTNVKFTHEIPAEHLVKSPRISISFRASKPTPAMIFQTNSAKRFKPDDDDIPEGDWLDKHILNTSNAEMIIAQQWDLDCNTFLYISIGNGNVRLHISDFSYSNKFGHYPTKQGVMMNTNTWNELCVKMNVFNTKYMDASCILNNQLAMFCDEEEHCILQQIFKRGTGGYDLKNNFIKLLAYQLEKIKEYMEEITKSVKNLLFSRLLPTLILKAKKAECNHLQHADSEEAKKKLFDVLYYEMCPVVRKLYKCEGCIIDHPSHSQHSCMMESMANKFIHVGKQAFLCINLRKVCEELCKRYCLCNYTCEFFDTISVDEYDNEVRIRM